MKSITKIICTLLAFSMIIALPVSAEEISPYASQFFGSHNNYLWATSSTSFQVWFSVTAVSGMAELGVDYIDVEKSSDGINWSVDATYTKEDYSNLVAKNTSSHTGYVTYSKRESGCQYRAYVRLYAKNNSGNVGYSGTYAYF